MTAPTRTDHQEDPVPAPDPRPVLLSALDGLTPLVAAVAPDDLDRPTPCEGWSVADLLAHLVAVEHRVAHVVGGGHPLDVPSMRPAADGDWPAAWAEGRQVVADALADDAVLEAEVAHPAGRMPGRQALFIYCSEVAVHTWDLAAGLGRSTRLDPGMAEAVLGAMRAALPAEPRGTERVPFGPVVAVPDDAHPGDRLLGWLGRDPAWTAPVR